MHGTRGGDWGPGRGRGLGPGDGVRDLGLGAGTGARGWDSEFGTRGGDWGPGLVSRVRGSGRRLGTGGWDSGPNRGPAAGCSLQPCRLRIASESRQNRARAAPELRQSRARIASEPGVPTMRMSRTGRAAPGAERSGRGGANARSRSPGGPTALAPARPLAAGQWALSTRP